MPSLSIKKHYLKFSSSKEEIIKVQQSKTKTIKKTYFNFPIHYYFLFTQRGYLVKFFISEFKKLILIL